MRDSLMKRALVGVTLVLFATGGSGNCIAECVVDKIEDQITSGGCLESCGCGDCADCGCDCTDCAACGDCGCALTKLEQEFPNHRRIPNAVQVRLTRAGRRFVENTMASALVTALTDYVVATSDAPLAVNDWATFCKDKAGTAYRCVVRFDVEELKLTPGNGPVIDGRLELFAELRHQVRSGEAWVDGGPGWPTVDVDDGEDDDCTLLYRTDHLDGGARTIRFEMDLRVPAAARGPRVGFNVLEADATGIHLEGVELDDLWDDGRDGQGDQRCGLPIDQIPFNLQYAIVEELQARFPRILDYFMDNGGICARSASGEVSGCPGGSASAVVDARGLCLVRNGDECIQNLEGAQGRLDLTAIFATFAARAEPVFDFLLAGYGGLTGNLGGLNYQLAGGLEGLATTDCVPVMPREDWPELPDDLELAEVLRENAQPRTGREPHVMVGISERYLNYALFHLWRSGALCAEVGTALDQILSGSALSLLFLTDHAHELVAFPEPASASAVGIGLRPQTPPVLAFRDSDPSTPERLVEVTLADLAMDVYLWAQDRYVRLFTFVSDLRVGLDLAVADNAIVVDTEGGLDLTFDHARVENAELIVSDHDLVVSGFESVMRIGVRGVAGAIPPIPLDDLLSGVALPNGTPLPVGIALESDSVDPFVQGSGASAERFLGIFLDLTAAPSVDPLTARAETSVEVTALTLPEDRRGFAVASFGEGPRPRVEIRMDARGHDGARFEYSYRLASGAWSPWSASAYAIVEDEALFLQQWHTVEARARIAGSRYSTDLSAASASFRVDVEPPSIEAYETEDGVELRAFDLVSDLRELTERHREPGGAFTAWAPLDEGRARLPGASSEVEIEVRDGSGNVASTQHALRGAPAPAATGGCSGCAAAGAGASAPVELASILLALAPLGRRRARRDRAARRARATRPAPRS